MAVEAALSEFKETAGSEAFQLQGSKMVKVQLSDETIQAKLGSMVAYQGDVKFEHAGSGGLKRMAKKAVTGEGAELMKISGTGEVFLADLAQEIQLVKLSDEAITVNGANLLAFDADIDWDIKKVEGVSGFMGGGLFNTHLSGSGYVAILSDGPPVLLELDGERDLRRPAGGDHLVGGRQDLGEDRRQPEDLHRPRLGRDACRWPSPATAGC